MTTGEPHEPVRQDSTAVRVGWLGLGAMGLPMARRLLADGFPVRAFDPGPDNLAAVACRTPAEAAVGVDVLAVMARS